MPTARSRVPDDLVGVRIRCPHCSAWLIVDESMTRKAASQRNQIQEGDIPPCRSIRSPRGRRRSRSRPTWRIQDLRWPATAVGDAGTCARRRLRDSGRSAQRYQMTDDDWTAFGGVRESDSAALAELTTAFWIGCVTLLMNVIVCQHTLRPKALEIPGRLAVCRRSCRHHAIGVGCPAHFRLTATALSVWRPLEMLPWYASGLKRGVWRECGVDLQHLFGG